MYENTDSYRSGVGLERYGVNPTIAAALGPNTIVRAGFERFYDDRTADRGVPSYQGRPLATAPSTFFGNAAASYAVATVSATFAAIEHKFSDDLVLKNRTSFADYDKFYQNVFPGAVDAAGATVSISGYNNDTQRKNLFNQTDLTWRRRTGSVDHLLLTGMELGRQETDNFRATAYFSTVGAATTAISVPVTAPTTTLPLQFRQSATDADNHGIAAVAAVYVQDQVALSPQVHAVVGVRYDDFDVEFRNNRTSTAFVSRDRTLSPRLGLIYKPLPPVSIYGSYSLAFQPRAGEQLSSLSLTNQSLEPETFRNYEAGVKWDVAGSSITVAVYDLERPIPTTRRHRSSLTASEHAASSWASRGSRPPTGASSARTHIRTAKSRARYRPPRLPVRSSPTCRRIHGRCGTNMTRRVGLGLGLIYRGDIFTATDNAVVMSSYLRADAAAFWTFTPNLGAQLNVENLFGERYYVFAHSNNNITPGSPRAVRLGLTTRF
jgi:catecholate siderophore receptor